MNDLYGPTSRGDGRRVALVGWGIPEFGDYARFYWHAGASLIEVGEGSRGRLSQLVFPILYLYRHALELALKDANVWVDTAILAAGSLNTVDREHVRSVDAFREEMKVHRLRPLLNRLHARAAVLDGSKAPRVEISEFEERVEPAVRALNAVDLDGQRFRYPYVSKGMASWTREEHGDVEVDVLALRDDIDRALAFLLDDLGSRFSSFTEEVFEEERLEQWVRQLFEAHGRAVRLEAEWGSWESAYRRGPDPDGDQGDSEFQDALKAEMSAEMLDDRDDP